MLSGFSRKFVTNSPNSVDGPVEEEVVNPLGRISVVVKDPCN